MSINASSTTYSSSITTTDATTAIIYAIFNYATFYLCAPLWPLCFACNLITVIIFTKTSCGGTRTTRFYYLIIAVGELGTGVWKYLLYFLVGNGLIFIGLEQYIPVYRSVDYRLPCAIHYILWYVFDDISNIPYVALGVERLIALFWPLKAKRLLKYRNSVIAMAAILILDILVNLPIIGVVNVVPSAYYVHGVYCAAGKINNFWQAYIAPVYLLYNYVVTPMLSILVSVILVLKIQSITKEKQKLSALGHQENMSPALLESCVTLLLISTIHVLFYITFGLMRIVTLQFGSLTGLTATQRDFFLAVNVNIAVFMMPIQFSNFVIYCRRLHGFYDNVKLLSRCKSFQS